MGCAIRRVILSLGIAGLIGTLAPHGASAHRPAAPTVSRVQQTGPVFTFPSNGQSFPLNSNMIFQVQPMGTAKGYLWSFVQGGAIMYQNLTWEGNLGGATYTIKTGSAAQRRLHGGPMQVWVRAWMGGSRWSSTSSLTVQLQSVGTPPMTNLHPQPQPTTAPSQPAPGTTLFYADTSGGLDKINGGSSWKHVSGLLVSDGSASQPTILPLPVHPTTANYAVEAQIQLVQGSCGFGEVARLDESNRGLGAGWYCSGTGANLVSGDPTTYFDSFKHQVSFHVDNAYHTYRLEVSGNSISLLVDGAQVLQGTDNKFLDPGQPGLWDNGGTQINVRSIRVIAL